MRKAIGKAMMVAGSAGVAAQAAGVNPFVGDASGGLPQNHDDWMAVLFQVIVAALGAIINGRGAGR